MDDLLLIAGPSDPVVADLAAFLGRGRRRVAVVSTADVCRRAGKGVEAHPLEDFSKAGLLSTLEARRLAGLVLFPGRRPTPSEQAALDAVAEAAAEKGAERACVVSTFRIHFGDRRAAETEARALDRLGPLAARTTVLRPGHVLSPGSRATAWLRALWFCYPLVPKRFTSCFLDGDELFAAIEREVGTSGSKRRTAWTLLGPNRAWRAVLKEHDDGSLLKRGLAGAAALLGLLQVGRVAGLLFDACARVAPALGRWNFDTLRPTSPRELLALYNPYNHRHVKVVGYNNGVVHFGQRYPGRTVVSTVRCNRVARVGGPRATFDAGVTVLQAAEALGRAGKEFHVAPNYSYVSLGTAFFVPIHGSASRFSTMGDTIDKVLLYDPAADRFVAARRGEPAFGEYAYNLERDVLLLRLRLQVKEKSQYYQARERLEDATGAEVLDVFRDQRPSNVEMRKARAAQRGVDVYRYYAEPPAGGGDALAVPRDAIGRLWDRIEANPVSSVLFHWFARRFTHHVELFIPPDEFPTFWQTHGSLPIMKLQLRYIKRDGLPHSPFRDNDCVSADLFMWKKHKEAFHAYIEQTFRAVRFNPGKHST